ncbi:MAG: hypothetical protein CM15mP59_0560 [Flavobacteriaceae bacterium]|nr:MAG: hypothetical protein CM15mP59_0560 [Flavobacteriaceae bacterium]
MRKSNRFEAIYNRMNTLYQFLRSRGYPESFVAPPDQSLCCDCNLNGTAGRFILDTGASTDLCVD